MIILDGGISRELQRLGAPFRQPEWSALALIEAPHLVRQAHADFIRAGAEVVTTNSYAVVPFHIGAARFAAEGHALAARAGRLAREAVAEAGAQGRVRVAASLPPLFGSYRPDLFDRALAPALLEPLLAGLAPHADLWLGETLSAIAEAELLARRLGDDPRPLWISFTLADDAQTPALRSGESVAQAACWAAGAGIAALLFNCSRPEAMGPAVEVAAGVLRAAGSALPLGVYANAFAPSGNTGGANETLSAIRDDLDPAAYLALCRSWARRGASILGGCCGIGAAHIAALAHGLACDGG